jgi:hypothetical protein
MLIVGNWNRRIWIINRRDDSDFQTIGVTEHLVSSTSTTNSQGMSPTMELRRFNHADISYGLIATRSASLGHRIIIFEISDYMAQSLGAYHDRVLVLE